MSFELTRLTIEGLNSTHSLDVKINDNRVVFVGVNGSGKTTTLNILYYMLSRQWSKLHELDFRRVSVVVNGTEISLDRKEIKFISDEDDVMKRYLKRFPPHVRANIRRIERHPLWVRFTEQRATLVDIRHLSDLIDVPVQYLRSVQEKQLELFQQEAAPFQPEAPAMSKKLVDRISQRVLHLPTYRRIERDLKVVVPDIEERFLNYSPKKVGENFLEIVEFGMDDVKSLINERMRSLSMARDNEFNDLVGRYLSQVIHGSPATFDFSEISQITDEQINSVLDRVREANLRNDDRSHLKEVIMRMASGPTERREGDGYTALFFLSLLSMANQLKKEEENIRQFETVCNRYLFKKKVSFDPIGPSLKIFDENGREIDMKLLSSGEKQIVSIFCHLTMRKEPFLVLIDEPELSLSMDWQKTILPDILATGNCLFLAAVTHSPFVFDNALDPYTVDIAAHIVPYSVNESEIML